MTSIYDFTLNDYLGNPVPLTTFEGKVLLIVNTATECGLTRQYIELQKLFETYRDQDFVILDFPCNQFKQQAPGSSEMIAKKCKANYGVEFPIFEKIEVNGPNASPLFSYLKEQVPEDTGSTYKHNLFRLVTFGFKPENEGDIRWNFTKFLVDRNGNVVQRFSPTEDPSSLSNHIESLL